jgi:hypothetical protein
MRLASSFNPGQQIAESAVPGRNTTEWPLIVWDAEKLRTRLIETSESADTRPWADFPGIEPGHTPAPSRTGPARDLKIVAVEELERIVVAERQAEFTRPLVPGRSSF